MVAEFVRASLSSFHAGLGYIGEVEEEMTRLAVNIHRLNNRYLQGKMANARREEGVTELNVGFLAYKLSSNRRDALRASIHDDLVAFAAMPVDSRLIATESLRTEYDRLLVEFRNIDNRLRETLLDPDRINLEETVVLVGKGVFLRESLHAIANGMVALDRDNAPIQIDQDKAWSKVESYLKGEHKLIGAMIMPIVSMLAGVWGFRETEEQATTLDFTMQVDKGKMLIGITLLRSHLRKGDDYSNLVRQMRELVEQNKVDIRLLRRTLQVIKLLQFHDDYKSAGLMLDSLKAKKLSTIEEAERELASLEVHRRRQSIATGSLMRSKLRPGEAVEGPAGLRYLQTLNLTHPQARASVKPLIVRVDDAGHLVVYDRSSQELLRFREEGVETLLSDCDITSMEIMPGGGLAMTLLESGGAGQLVRLSEGTQEPVDLSTLAPCPMPGALRSMRITKDGRYLLADYQEPGYWLFDAVAKKSERLVTLDHRPRNFAYDGTVAVAPFFEANALYRYDFTSGMGEYLSNETLVSPTAALFGPDGFLYVTTSVGLQAFGKDGTALWAIAGVAGEEKQYHFDHSLYSLADGRGYQGADFIIGDIANDAVHLFALVDPSSP